jgi:hypothetical protein
MLRENNDFTHLNIDPTALATSLDKERFTFNLSQISAK